MSRGAAGEPVVGRWSWVGGFRAAGAALVLTLVGLAGEAAALGRSDAGSVPARDGGTALSAEALTRPVEVTADKLEIFGKEKMAIYSGHAKATRDTTTITCDKLTVRYTRAQQVESIVAEDHVEAVDGDRSARGDRAEYDNTTGVLVVTGNPEAKQGGNEVKGSKVTFSSGSDVVEVENAETTLEQSKTIHITAQKLRIESAKNVATWSGHVRANRATTDIAADTLIARYDDKQQLTRVEALGHAEVHDGDRWAKGERADFDVRRGLLVVTGSPEVHQGQNVMVGTKATFTVGTDILEVENATTKIAPKNPPKK